MYGIWVIGALVLLAGCASNSTQSLPPVQERELVLTFDDNTDPQQTKSEDRQKLRELLDVFYRNRPQEWEQARAEILQMGSVGVECLCLFLLKFFWATQENLPVDKSGDPSLYWHKARKELVRLQEKAVPYLLLAMAHHKSGTTGRMQCSLTLSEIGRPALPALLENLGKGSNQFKRILLETLGTIGDKSAASGIVSLYKTLPKISGTAEEILDKDPSWDVRQYCMKALGRLKAKDGLTAVEEALEDPHPDVRRKAMEVLPLFPYGEALPILYKAVRVAKDSGWSKNQRQLERRIQELMAKIPD